MRGKMRARFKGVMFTKTMKIIAGLVLVLIVAWILFWFALSWPAFRVLNEVLESPRSNFIVKATFNKNMPTYESLNSTQDLINPFSGKMSSLYVPKNTSIQLQLLSEDKVYKFVAREIEVSFDIVPGFLVEKRIDPPAVGEHTLIYEISTDEGSWPFRIEFIDIDKLKSSPNIQTDI